MKFKEESCQMIGSASTDIVIGIQRDTWPVTMREECRLRVFENGVLREIFGADRDKVTGE